MSNLKITYDPEGDILYIELKDPENDWHDTVDLDGDVTADVDRDGRILAIEILFAKERVDLSRLRVERLLEDRDVVAELPDLLAPQAAAVEP